MTVNQPAVKGLQTAVIQTAAYHTHAHLTILVELLQRRHCQAFFLVSVLQTDASTRTLHPFHSPLTQQLSMVCAHRIYMNKVACGRTVNLPDELNH